MDRRLATTLWGTTIGGINPSTSKNEYGVFSLQSSNRDLRGELCVEDGKANDAPCYSAGLHRKKSECPTLSAGLEIVVKRSRREDKPRYHEKAVP